MSNRDTSPDDRDCEQPRHLSWEAVGWLLVAALLAVSAWALWKYWDVLSF